MRSTTAIALAVVVLAALGLRLFGLNWDDGRDLHPDELYVAKIVLTGRIFFTWPPDWANLLDPETSGLNPRSADPNTGELRDYPYGALPLLVTDTMATMLGWITGVNWNAAERAYLVGRALSALLDTLTVIVVYAVAVRVFSTQIGLFAALFAALAPMSIQLAHFFTTDSWLTFFVSITLYCAIRAAEAGTGRWFAAAGLGFGLAMATKGSVFALAGVIGAALVYDGWRRWRAGRSPTDILVGLPPKLGLAAIAALLGFGLFEPYAFVRPGIYLFSLQRQAEIVSGTFDIPFTRVYIGTIPVVYQLEQFVRWGFGPVAGVLALTGVLIVGRRFWRRPTAGQWILLSWLLGYGLVIAIPETKFLRYLAPLVPGLAITAAVALSATVSLVRRRGGARLALATLSVLLAGSALWTVAFERIYAAEHPRLAASRWIYANVPAGSTLSWEYWDDRLPKPLGPGLTEADYQYQFFTIDLYRDQPPAEAADELYRTLEQLDYVVHTSDRVATAIPRSPWRYPVQNRFLNLLRTGRLGFEDVAEFHVTPGLGPLTIDDRAADESFINYDHPRVTIYRKTDLVSKDDFDLLMAWAVARPWSPTRYPEQAALLLDQPVGTLPVVGDARWSASLTSNSAAALAVWIILLVVFQAIGWPLVRQLLPTFGELGWGIARLVLLVVVGYVVWFGASARLIQFRAVWCAVALAALGIVAWVLTRHRTASPLTRPQLRSIIGAEVTFWAVFAFFLLFRYLNPDSWHPIWGGEKPMEFAHLNATLRSAYFPPYDPWYADGYINYYYYGLYLVAFCLKLTGIPAEIGFNLAQPTVIALLAAASYTVAATLGRELTRHAPSALPAGILGAVILLAIGNLTSLGRLLSGDPHDFGSFLDWVWAGSRAISDAITEFPFFTALYADLHAHVIALPITVLAIALSYSLARTGGEDWSAFTSGVKSAGVRLAARGLLLMLVLGTLFPTNAWDVPVYAALAAGAIILGSRVLGDWRRRTAWAAVVISLVAGGAYLLFRPFHEHYVALFGSLAPVREPTAFVEVASHIGGLAAIAILGMILLALPRRPASPWPVDQPGTAVAVVLVALLALSLAARLQPALAPAVIAVLLVIVGTISAVVISTWIRVFPAPRLPRVLVAAAGALLSIAAVASLATGRPVLAGYLILAALAIAVWLLGASVAARFVALMVLAAASVGAGTEVVFVVDDLAGTSAYRMNTFFKFYNQIWVLLALTGAALVARMLFDSRWFLRPARADSVSRLSPGAVTRTGWARAGLIVASVVIAGSLTYPLFATLPRLSQRFESGLGSGTLNALDWMNSGTLTFIGPDGIQPLTFADDRAAIEWLNENVAGSPVIAEASIGPYRCNGSRFSIATGLPTIIGWERHQQQQRDRDLLPERVADVRSLYTSTDTVEKEAILRKYNVEYVIVGDIERHYIVPSGNDCQATGSPAGTAAFDAMTGEVLEVAFTQGDTTIYRVLPVSGQAARSPGGARHAVA